MVEIEYLPYQKIIVHEIRKFEVQDFLVWVATQAEATKQGAIPSVNWVDGVAFLTGEFMTTPEIVSENLQGRVHFAVVFFTETPFTPERRVNIGGHDVSVRFTRGDFNPNFVELAKFLKTMKWAVGA